MNLRDYISGKREGKEANRLEQDALNKPLLHDAIDGYDAVQDDHLSALDSLEAALDKRIRKQKSQRFVNRRVLAIAASIALLIGIGSLFLIQNIGDEETPFVADGTMIKRDSATVNERDSMPSVDEKIRDTLQIEAPTLVVPESLIADYTPAPDDNQQVGDKDVDADQSEALSEVVTIGYGRQRKDDITGSGGRVKGLEIQGKIKIDSIIPNRGDNFFVADASPSKKEKAKTTSVAITQTGQVLDEFGDPIAGASVFVEGTTIGVVTDLDGRFSLTIPAGTSNKLTTSYIGYESQELTLSAGDDLAYVHLQPSMEALSEVVVIGYGTQRKSDITGSVSRVKGSKKDRFGKKQFRVFLTENMDRDLCEEDVIKVSVKFYLDKTGMPTNIQVSQTTCEELEDELIYWLENGPQWTKRNQHIKLRLKMRFHK